MIVKSHIKQKKRSVLILIQLSVAFFSFSVGLGFIEVSIKHVNDVKSIISTNSINLYSLEESSSDINEEKKNKLLEFYKDLREDKRILYMGSYMEGYIKSQYSDRQDEEFRDVKVIGIDNELANMLNIKTSNNKTLDSLSNNANKNSVIPVIVGENVAKKIALSSTKTIMFSNNLKYNVKISAILKKNSNFFQDGNGKYITRNINKLDDYIVFVLPKGEKTAFENVWTSNILIQLKNDTDNKNFISSVQNSYMKHNLEVNIGFIKDEIDDFVNRNKPIIGFAIGFSIIIFILSCFGLTGVVLASILRRKLEFGVRYSIGATPKKIITLIIGEIMCLFILGGIVGNILAIILSLITGAIGVGVFTVGISTFIMIIFGVLCSVFPALKIAKMKPIELIRK